jgi:hypothetical protein
VCAHLVLAFSDFVVDEDRSAIYFTDGLHRI